MAKSEDMWKSILILSFLSFTTCQLWCQLHSNPVIINEGLPSVYTTDIVKDGHGIIWIGTTNGFCSYDGTSFEFFQHNKADEHSLVHPFITEMVFDSIRNVLWISTADGLSKFDLATHTFENFFTEPSHGIEKYEIEAIALDHSSGFWCSINGLGLAEYHEDSSNFAMYPIPTSFPLDVDMRKTKTVMDIASGARSQNKLWVGTGMGLLEFSLATKAYHLHFFEGSDAESTRYLNQVRTILPFGNMLLIGTWSSGYSIYEPPVPSKEVEIISPDRFKNSGGFGIDPPLLFNHDGRVIINSRSNCLFDLRDERISDCISIKNSVGKTFGFQVQMEDDEKRYWATSEYGVLLFDSLNHQFENYSFPAIDPFYYTGGELLELDDRGEILQTYEHGQGVYLFDLKARSFQLIEPSEKQYMYDRFFKGEGIIKRSNDQYLVLERRKMYSYTPSKKTLAPLDLPIDDLGYLWYAIDQDQRGGLWIGSIDSGLVHLNIDDGSITTFRKELELFSTDEPVSIYNLFADSRDRIWISLENGAIMFEPQTSVFKPLAVGNQTMIKVKNVVEDANGVIWCSLENMGLGKIIPADLTGDDPIQIRMEEELLRKDVTRIIDGRDGTIWMITFAGVQQYDPKTEESIIYNGKDGLNIYDPQFNRNPTVLTNLVELSNGNIAFAPRAGLTIFSPSQMQQNLEIPKPYIKEFRWGDSSVFNDIFEQRNPIRVPFHHRAIEIKASAIGYTQSEYNQFFYQLNQVMPAWEKSENQLIRFPALSSGDYTLKLKVKNSHGLESGIHEVRFIILKPWWQTIWFIGLTLLVIGGIIWSLIKFRDQNRARILEKEKEVQVLLAGLESRALRNQMNPHFLFNIFNTIQELILTGDTEKAYSYTSKFSKLLRMILDNAKKDDISIEKEVEFLTLYLELEALRFEDAFSFSIHVEEGLDFYHIPVFMVQPLVENAIRHGLLPKEGDKQIDITFTEDNDEIICTVSDNGVGLTQKDGKMRQDRDHALKIIRKRLDVIKGGYLKVVNNPEGQGVKAILQTPLIN
jgi:hypothetical protein